MRDPRFEVYEAIDGWRWRLVAANGRILASGEAFASKRNTLRAVDTAIDAIIDKPDLEVVVLPFETAGRNRHSSR